MIRSDRKLPFGVDRTSQSTADSGLDRSAQFTSSTADESVFGCSDQVKKIKSMPMETRCCISTDYKPGKICAHSYYRGTCIETYGIMPDISDVKVIKDQSGNDRAVVVKFCDNTEMKATVDGKDVYSLDQGVSVCITKRLIGCMVGMNNCSAMYNKIIKRAMQVKKNNEKMREHEIQERQRKEKKYAKLVEKKRMRKERIEAARREAEIELRKEAYKRAIMEIEKERAEA